MIKTKKSMPLVLYTILIIVAVVSLFALGSFIVFTVKSILDAEHYCRVYEHPMEVVATVTDYDSYDDDDDTDYRSYVTYTVDGKTYQNVKFEDKDEIGDLTPIGQEVTIEVSPEDPSRLLSSLKNNSHFLIFSAFVLSAVLAGLHKTLVGKKRSDDLIGTPDQDIIIRDMKLTIKSRFSHGFFLLVLLIFIFFNIRYSAVFADVIRIIAVVSGVIWLLCLVKAWREIRLAEKGEFELHRDVLVRKEISNDPDDSYKYRLHYRSGEKQWHHDTNEAKFNLAKEGDTVLTVYLPGKKKPLLHYDTTGDAC